MGSCTARCGPWLRSIQCDFFPKIADQLKTKRPGGVTTGYRSVAAIKHEWGSISLAVSMFVGCCDRAEANAPSGTSENDVIVAANLFFGDIWSGQTRLR